MIPTLDFMKAYSREKAGEFHTPVAEFLNSEFPDSAREYELRRIMHPRKVRKQILLGHRFGTGDSYVPDATCIEECASIAAKSGKECGTC